MKRVTLPSPAEPLPVLLEGARLDPRDREALADWTQRAIRGAHGVWHDRRHEIEADVILRHLWLADSIARRYRRRGEEDDDLTQVARRGLVEAVHRYDPEHGSFVSFAVPTISGVVKRHFRDHGWLVRPPRPTQHLAAEIRRSWPELAQQLGSDPTDAQLADALDAPLPEIREARRASQGYTHAVFDATGLEPGGPVDEDVAGELSATEARLIIRRACQQLTTDEVDLLVLRFVEDRTQSDIAGLIGTSQMQVSRRLARLLAHLREIIGPMDELVKPVAAAR